MNKQKLTVPIMGVITIISIVALVVVLTLKPSNASGEDKILVKVNGENITQNDLYEVLYEQRMQDGQLAGDAFLKQLVNDKILKDELDRMNITVSDSELEERIQEEIDIMVDMYGSMETLEFILLQGGMSMDDIKNMMREQLPDQMRLEKIFADDVEIAEEEVTKYYEENQAQFEQEEQFEVAHIFVEDEETANEILSKLKAGEDFAALADEHSEDTTAGEGGVLGWLTSEDIDYNYGEQFLEAASSLPVGETSDVVMGYDGYHILKVTDHKEEGIQPFEEVREQIEKMLYDEQIRSLVNEWIEKQLNDAEVEYIN